MENIGQNLKTSREEANKSIYQVEKEIKISHQQLYNWEKGKNEPSITQCIKLADYYGITLDELVGREFGHKKETKINAKYYKCNF